MSPLSVITLLALFTSATPLTIAVTHASGRMGVSVLGQLRESRPDLSLVAIVRSKEEEDRLRLDLCGAVIKGGVMSPLRSLEDDLGIRPIVIRPYSTVEVDDLRVAFAKVDAAVLLSAAHADFAPSSFSPTPAPPSLVTGPAYLARGTELARQALSSRTPASVRVPAAEQARAAARLSLEIAAARSSPALRRVALRSVMGCDEPSEFAVDSMGGESNLASCLVAEESILTCPHPPATVLRLGALLDGAGGAPLEFYTGEEEKARLSGDDDDQPPIISRNDAARVMAGLVLDSLEGKYEGSEVVSCSWSPRWGVSSVGTEEVTKIASRQDVVGEARGKARSV